MSTVQLPNIRIGSDVVIKAKLHENGVAVNWSTLTGVKAFAYSDTQRIMGGELECAVSQSDPYELIVNYRTTVLQYLGPVRLVVRGVYQSNTKTFDVPAFNFVATTAEATGVTVLADPQVSVTLVVTEIASSVIQEIVDACIIATGKCTEVYRMPLQVKLENNHLYASYDRGATWNDLGEIQGTGGFDIHTLTPDTYPANADEFAMYKSSASAHRKITWQNIMSRIQTALGSVFAAISHTHTKSQITDFPTIPSALSDLHEDATHRTVTDAQKNTWTGKQDTLVSGTNIKTVNNQSLLGAGNIEIQGGGSSFNIHSLTEENTLADADELAIYDISASAHRKTTWGNILGKIGAALSSVFAAISHTHTKSQITDLDMTAYRTSTAQDAIDAGKVDKVAGKGLSSNDYDNTEKSNVAANTSARHTHSNKGVLDGITQTLINAWNGAVSALSGKQDATNSLTTEDAIANADELPFYDSSASASRKTTWSNIISKIGTALGSVFAAISHTHTKSQITDLDMTAYRTSVAQDTVDAGKVDKVAGKGLSSNDYDNTEKSNVAANTTARHTHSNKGVLDGITQTLINAWNGAVSALSGKQDTLVSGTNIKTVNNQSLLGGGNITIQGGGASIVSKTYAELKALKASNSLAAGQLYRITDFVTMTYTEDAFMGDPIRSAGHPFDLIIVATGVNTFGEEAMAVLHEGDTYFANCDLSSWKIRYCFDNSFLQYAWAKPDAGNAMIIYEGEDEATGMPQYWVLVRDTSKDAVGYTYGKAWYYEVGGYTMYTNTETPVSGEDKASAEPTNDDEEADLYISYYYPSSDTGGKGVIYYMKDEFGNECPYDFKNIQFKRGWNSSTEIWSDTEDLTDGQYCFTFSQRGDEDTTDFVDMTVIGILSVERNSIAPISMYGRQALNNICLFGDENVGTECYGNIFEPHCDHNSLVSGNCNIFMPNSQNIVLGCKCGGNIFYGCSSNILGKDCWGNIFQVGSNSNTLGSDCIGNIFEPRCSLNVLGDDCEHNHFSGFCQGVKFSADATGDTPGNYFKNIILEGDLNNLILYNTQTASLNNVVRYYRIIGSDNISGAIQLERQRDYYTTIAKNSSGVLKTYCEANLAN